MPPISFPLPPRQSFCLAYPMDSSDTLQILQRLTLTGEVDQALRLGEQQASKLGDNTRFHSLMGQLHAQRGDLVSAERHFRRATALAPHDSGTWLNLGLVLERQHQWEAAEQAYRQALAQDPQHPQAHDYLGDLLRQRGHLQEALHHLQRAQALAPQDPGILNNLALIHQALDAPQTAERLLREALALHPDHWRTLSNLGALLKEMERDEEACALLRRALALAPHYPPAVNNLGVVLRRLGQPDEAVSLLRPLVERYPGVWEYHLNFSTALRDSGDISAALQQLDRAIRHLPEEQAADFQWSRSFLHLLLGHYQSGWEDYEWGIPVEERRPRPMPAPRWQGEPLTGTLYILAEQGIGDQIMFATCIPDAVSHAGPRARVMLECERRLVPLFRRSFPQCHVRPRPTSGEAPPKAPEDLAAQIPIGSLPRLFRNRPEDFPRQQRLLQADPKRIAFWRERFRELGPGRVIGLSWRAGGHDTPNRNLELCQLAPVLRTPGVHWIDMQYWASADERRAAETQLGIRLHRWPECDPFHDLDELAAQMAACDGMLTIANTNAHLAGALGVPSLVLLPFVPSWRWGIQGEETPWYASLRLLRQPRLRDWDSVIDTLREQFPRWLNELG